MDSKSDIAAFKDVTASQLSGGSAPAKKAEPKKEEPKKVEETKSQPQKTETEAKSQPKKSQASAASTAALDGNPYQDEPITNMRKVIAERLLESKTTVPHYYLETEINMDTVIK